MPVSRRLLRRKIRQGSDLLPGELMVVGQSISSPDGRFMMIHQTDGHLVVYRAHGDNPYAEVVWACGAYGFNPGVCAMQCDGNLVVYDADRVPRWASGTDGHPGLALRLQIDGSVVLHKDGQIFWQTNQATPDPTPPVRIITIVNTSPASVRLRFYDVNDGVRLPDGDQTIPSGGSVAWPLPANYQAVKVTFNGRSPRTIAAGDSYTFADDERVRVINHSPRPINARIFNYSDLLRLVALPGGEFTVPNGGEAVWEVPQDIDRAVVVLNGR